MGVWVNSQPPRASPYQPPPPAFDPAPAGLRAWAARAQATCHVWGLASTTSSAHRTVQKQFWFFVDSVAQCSFDEFAAAPTEGLCAFAQWCSDRPRCKAFGPLRAASVEQYVGTLISAMRIRHTPLKVDRSRLNFFFGALLRQETHTIGPPPLKKAPLTADMLDALCASPHYAAVSSAVSAGRPPPRLAPRAFNTVIAAAAACYSLATGARASSVTAASQLEFNPLIHAARGDVVFSNDGFRYEHKPCKNDQHAKIWKGPSPLFPAIPSSLCCPLRATQVRDALLPNAELQTPVRRVRTRRGATPPHRQATEVTGARQASPPVPGVLHFRLSPSRPRHRRIQRWHVSRGNQAARQVALRHMAHLRACHRRRSLTIRVGSLHVAPAHGLPSGQ